MIHNTPFLPDSVDIVQILIWLGLFVLSLVIGLSMAPVMSWQERRQCAILQKRLGPNRVGPLGLLQPLADALKLMYKEDFVPPYVHRFFYLLAPMIPGIIAVGSLALVPWGRDQYYFAHTYKLQLVDTPVGWLLFFACSSLMVYAVSLAGWASNNKYALLGGLRAAAQMISYEIPMAMAIVPLSMIYGTFDIQKIVSQQTQGHWGIVLAPVSFIVFFVCMLAESNRVPFDLAESEGELVAGFLTEYGAMRWSLFFLGEYCMLFVMCVLMVCLFLGGYNLPFVSYDALAENLTNVFGIVFSNAIIASMDIFTLIIKVAVLLFLFVQLRFTLPRFRYDQLIRISWKQLFLLSLVNLFAMSAMILYTQS
jgi:NADH-quinone oxidoreductase subunit H